MKDALGAPLWFKLHRGLQSAAILLMIAGFVVIYGAGIELSPATEKHGAIGLAVMIMACVQGVMGYARNVISGKTADGGADGGTAKKGRVVVSNPTYMVPKFPNSGSTGTDEEAAGFAGFAPPKTAGHADHGPRRWLFNYMHITNGYLLLVLGFVNVGLGVSMENAAGEPWAGSISVTIFYVGMIAWVVAYIAAEAKQKGLSDMAKKSLFYVLSLVLVVCAAVIGSQLSAIEIIE